jgi:Flp pilus assembly protein TadG
MKHEFSSNLKLFASRARRDQGGQVAIIFALSLIPIMAFIGSSVDFSRAVTARSNLQQATDATILAVSKFAQDGSTAAQIKAQAVAYLKAVSTDPYAAIVGDPTISTDKTKVCLNTSSHIDTAIMKIFQISQVAVSSSACTVTNNATFEIAMVLDTTGSMANSDGTNSKIASMRSAADQFVDYMYTSTTLASRVKISVVPFAASVAVDTAYKTAAWLDGQGQSSWNFYSPLFTGASGLATNRFTVYGWLKSINSNWDWRGCLEEQAYPANVQDTPPNAATPDTLFVPMLAPDEPDPTYKDSKNKTQYNPYTYNNDYLDDNSSTCTGAQPTGATLADETTKQSRVCKYKSGTRTTSYPTSYGPQYGCTASPLVRMTNNTSTLKAKIDSLQAAGNTNIHQGFMWGWRTLSPNAPFADGQPYGTPDLIKIIVLMTDGMNTWSDTNSALDGSEYGPYGYYNTANARLPTTNRNVTTSAGARNAIDALTREACSNARTAGVIVYTIGFSVPTDPIDSQGLQLLQDCAGNSARSFVANNSSSLISAFAQIGSSIGTLRLSN